MVGHCHVEKGIIFQCLTWMDIFKTLDYTLYPSSNWRGKLVTQVIMEPWWKWLGYHLVRMCKHAETLIEFTKGRMTQRLQKKIKKYHRLTTKVICAPLHSGQTYSHIMHIFPLFLLKRLITNKQTKKIRFRNHALACKWLQHNGELQRRAQSIWPCWCRDSEIRTILFKTSWQAQSATLIHCIVLRSTVCSHMPTSPRCNKEGHKKL